LFRSVFVSGQRIGSIDVSAVRRSELAALPPRGVVVLLFPEHLLDFELLVIGFTPEHDLGMIGIAADDHLLALRGVADLECHKVGTRADTRSPASTTVLRHVLSEVPFDLVEAGLAVARDGLDGFAPDVGDGDRDPAFKVAT